MLNMLPKLDESAIRRYLNVFANVCGPRRCPRDLVQTLLEKNDVGRLFCDVNGILDRNAHIRLFERQDVVHAIPHVRDHMTVLAERADDPLFLFGGDAGKNGNRRPPRAAILHR